MQPSYVSLLKIRNVSFMLNLYDKLRVMLALGTNYR